MNERKKDTRRKNICVAKYMAGYIETEPQEVGEVTGIVPCHDLIGKFLSRVKLVRRKRSLHDSRKPVITYRRDYKLPKFTVITSCHGLQHVVLFIS